MTEYFDWVLDIEEYMEKSKECKQKFTADGAFLLSKQDFVLDKAREKNQDEVGKQNNSST